MKMHDISKRQKMILTVVGIVALAFVVFIIFIYLPSKKQMEQVRRTLSAAEGEINKIKRSASGAGSLEEMVSALKAMRDDIDKRFPSKEELVLRELPKLAAKSGMEVVALRPNKKDVIKEIAGEKIAIRGYAVQQMPVSLSLRSSYMTLGEFIKTLKTDFPIYVSVDDVRMGKSGEKAGDLLNIELSLNTYMLTPQGASSESAK